MSTTTENKTAKLTLTRLLSTKKLTRADGGSFNMHRVTAKSAKGEFDAVIFADDNVPPPELNVEKSYSITPSKKENEWVIRELRDKKPWSGGSTAKTGQEIHAAALLCAKDLLLAGKVGTVDDMLRLSEELATKLLRHHKSLS